MGSPIINAAGGIMVPPVAVTNSRWEKYVDNFMLGVEEKVGRFEAYAKSDAGQYRIGQVQMIAIFAAALILGSVAPVVVGCATVAGITVRVFSAEQLKRVQDALSDISAHLPFGVKALTVVLAMTYTPVVFPIIAGLGLGFEIGAKVSPQSLASKLDDAAAVVEHKVGAGAEDHKDGEVLANEVAAIEVAAKVAVLDKDAAGADSKVAIAGKIVVGKDAVVDDGKDAVAEAKA